MRFDTLGGQCFLAHPLICGGYGGGEIFSTPESDDGPPQKSGQKLRVGVGRESKFSQENCMLLKLISIEKRSHFVEK